MRAYEFLLEGLTFKGYPCTYDCSGHQAGHEYATHWGLEPDECPYGRSNSFWEGCKSKGEEQQEELEEDAVDEMAGEIHGGVRKALKDKGYKYLGSGIDKQAYLEPGTGQVLVVFGYRKGHDDFSPDQRMFIDWIQYCNKNKNNLHLPKFSGFESFEFQGKKYIQARMEPLQEIPSRLKELVSYLEDAAEYMGIKDFNAALKRLTFAGNWDDEADEFKYDTVEQIIDFLGGPDQAAKLLNTVYQVKEFSKQHGYSLDLHSGNYMQRPNGTIVVNDPFVLWINE